MNNNNSNNDNKQYMHIPSFNPKRVINTTIWVNLENMKTT